MQAFQSVRRASPKRATRTQGPTTEQEQQEREQVKMTCFSWSLQGNMVYDSDSKFESGKWRRHQQRSLCKLVEGTLRRGHFTENSKTMENGLEQVQEEMDDSDAAINNSEIVFQDSFLFHCALAYSRSVDYQ